jgi:hypothetical protein
MAEITTATATPVPPATAPKPAAAAGFSLQGVENTIFTFLQAHYAKVVGFLAGFATSHFGVVGKFLGKLF